MLKHKRCPKRCPNELKIPVWDDERFKRLFELDRATQRDILYWNGKVIRGCRRLNSHLLGFAKGADPYYSIRELRVFIDDIHTMWDKMQILYPELASVFERVAS